MKVSLPPGAELFVGMFIILGVIVFFPYIIKFIRFTGLWLLPVEVLLIDTLLGHRISPIQALEGVASQDASPMGAGAHCGGCSRYLQTYKRFIGLKAERTPTGNVGVLFSIDMK